MAEASKNRLEPVLVTFHPHPRVVVSPGDIPLLLTAIEEKLAILPNFFDGTVLWSSTANCRISPQRSSYEISW